MGMASKIANYALTKTLIIGAVAIFIVLRATPTEAYTPPKGIPNPSSYWGAFGEIDKAAPSVAKTGNPNCTNWPSSATTGYYFIDNSNVNYSCSDTSNPYGYPNKPRCSPPANATNLPAGSVVYFDGGTYTGGIYYWYGAGTDVNPIWIMGNPSNRPVFTRQMYLGYNGGSASYFVLDNLSFRGRFGLRTAVTGYNIDHVIVRNSTFQGYGKSTDLPNLGDVSDGGALSIGASTTGGTANYVVVHNVNISDYGYVGPLGVGGEEGGIYKDYLTDYTWILNSIIHNVGSDGISGSHNSNDTNRKTEHAFIGGNILYGNGENGIDLKGVNHVVISENTIYGPFQDEQGWGIVLHGGPANVPVKDAWIIFNKIYHASGGIYSVAGKDIYYVGNLIYDISNSYAAASDPWNGACFLFSSTSGEMFVIDNTCYDFEKGVDQAASSLSSDSNMQIHGNIFNNKKGSGSYEIKSSVSGTGYQYISMDYNLLNASSAIYWRGASRNLSYMQGTENECVHCLEADPKFAIPGTDFNLQPSSLAKDASVEGPVGNSAYNTFYSLFGVSIKKDFTGTLRPQGTLWDIGAYEYIEPAQSDTMPPKKPSGFRIRSR